MAGRRGKPRARRKGVADISIYVDWLTHIRNASRKSAVITGHRKDAEVLKSLGVKNVHYVTEPYFAFIDRIAGLKKECILLFDATHAGNIACARIGSDLLQNGVRVNTRFRKLLFTCPSRELGGFLGFIHGHVAISRRQRESLPGRL